jgi:hypothetical protein
VAQKFLLSRTARSSGSRLLDVRGEQESSVPPEAGRATRFDRVQKCKDKLWPFITKRIAHQDRTEKVPEPKLRDLHHAIDVLNQVWVRYDTMVRATGYATLEIALDPDWMRPLELAWIPNPRM